MNNQIVGRHAEITALERAFCSDEAEFVAVYGRRRIGKTFLVRSFFEQKKCFLFQLVGIHDASMVVQLNEFTKELENFYRQADICVQLKQPLSWLDAFEQLTAAVKHAKGKVVLFFDEFPWMATKKSQLLQAIDYYWNRYWVDNPAIKLIICGSAASWIIENILNNKGGLHNRVTMRLPMQPFSLRETKAYLASRFINLDNRQVLRLYLCMGGIPFYLKFIKQSLSAVQNINQLFFGVKAALQDEFDNLFSSLFHHSDLHESIVKLLAAKRNGVSRSSIETFITLKGGGLTRALNELEQAGFIEAFIPWGRNRGVFYKLVDEYSLFYLNWVCQSSRARLKGAMGEDFWQASSQSAAWRAWSGYAFEAVCFKHLRQIRKVLKIPDASEASTWHYMPTGTSAESGAQIDLLFDRQDGLMNICEIKYSDKPFRINKVYAESLRKKLEIYQKVTKTPKQLCLSMITVGGLATSTYSQGLVWSVATLDSLFEEIEEK